MARAKKETTEIKKSSEKFSVEYYNIPENWETAEEIFATCFRKSDAAAALKISEVTLDRLITSKGFESWIELRDQYRNSLITSIGSQVFKKIKSGNASEKFLQFMFESYYLPALKKFEEEQQLDSADGIIFEKPIFDFSDGNNITLEFLVQYQQQNIEEILQKEKEKDDKSNNSKG